MSGDLFGGMGAVCELLGVDPTSLESVDSFSHNWNPLNCLVCKKQLMEPVSLSCHHVFCRPCLVGSRGCPLCGKEKELDNLEEKRTDSLILYLIDSSQEASDVCANCDQIVQPMFFCETCQQPLCAGCKDQTHHAKMFSAHKILPLEERTGLQGRRTCPEHDEPFILFSTESKKLVCIKCFRKASLESRPHYLDLDIAHRGGCEKLDKQVSKLKSFQQETKDEMLLNKKLLEELNESTVAQSTQIKLTCQQMIDSLIEVRDRLLRELQDECSLRSDHFKKDLKHLYTLTPSIQLYLLSASILCSSATRLDFLELAFDLMKRMQSLMHEHKPISPSFTGQLESNCREEFARALEPHLGLSSLLFPAEVTAGTDSPRVPKRSIGGYVNCPGSNSNLNWSLTKYQLMVDLAGAFGEEYAKLDGPLRNFTEEMALLGKETQEIQRDITMRRCMIERKRVDTLIDKCISIETKLNCHTTTIQETQPNLQLIWQEALDRVRRQQLMFRQQVEASVQLKADARRVVQATTQLYPFIQSIATALQTISPRRCHPPDPAPMEQICLQINTLEPDSRHRVDAIEKEETKRKAEMEERKRNQLHLATLRDTKKHLKAPKEHGTRRKTATILRAVDRERTGTEPGLLSPSSGNKKQKDRGTGSPSPQSPIQSPDESFELEMDNKTEVSVTPAVTSKLARSHTLHVTNSTEKYGVKSSFVDDSNVHLQLSSSFPQHESFLLGKKIEELNLTNRETRSESNPESSSPIVVVKPIPKAPKVPTNLTKNIDLSVLEARDKVLASLKEKVPRIEIGVSNSPIRELEAIQSNDKE